ncbi:MAG: ATP-binding protein [Prevotella sp.]|nr:ATP-binding protein [Prevotella sp.]
MITKEELRQLLKSTETYRIERTVSTGNKDKFSEAICAFSNDLPGSHKNGYLIIGAEDDGEIKSGFKVTDALLKNIAALRSDGNILPIPTMSVDRYEFPEGDLLVCEVQSPMTPVRYRGRVFVRIGPRRDIASEDEERILTERRTANMATFDVTPCLRAKLSDLNVDMIRNGYLPKAVDADVLAADNRSLEEQMASVGLYDMDSHCPTNAAVILFAHRPKQFIPGAYVQYVKFGGNDKASDIFNERMFTSCLFDLLPKLDTFTENSVVTTRPVPVTAFREEQVVNYPREAIRELLLNAVMHRDYSSNMPIRYYEFSDRLEIMNAGGLYGKARPENFPHVNDYRNPIIAEALKNLGYVNMFNRGVSRVKELFKENGNPPIDFNVDKITVFEVVVKPNKSNTRPAEPTSQIRRHRGLIPSKTELDKLVFYCREPRSLAEILSYMGYSDRTKFRNKYIKLLLQQGRIRMTLPDMPTSKRQKYVASEKAS